MDEQNRKGTFHVPFHFRGGALTGDATYENEEDNESSEDELDIILNGTPEQKRRLCRSLSRGSLQMSSSEDEFEKEMEQELNATMKQHEKQFVANVERRLASNAGSSSSGQAALSAPQSSEQTPTVKQFYDDIYFDSDDEEESSKGAASAASAAMATKAAKATDVAEQQHSERGAKKHKIPSNDELLYDPNIDNDNQTWMNKQRAQYYPKKVAKSSPDQSANGDGDSQNQEDMQTADATGAAQTKQKSDDVHKTDAILNCPACMTTLCIDCQRHELYANQFRAMFVMNCCIVRSEQLRYPVSKKKDKRRWRRKRKQGEEEEGEGADGEGGSSDELYHPVKCSICNTEVAVLDKNDIFHFFNVLSSAA